MNESLPDKHRSKNLIIGVFHVLLSILGLYNLFFRGSYFLDAWKSLHAQGIGHLYFIIAAFVSSWWLIAAGILCFMGNILMPNSDDKIGFKSFIMPLVGAATSLVLPSLMLTGWFIVIVWIRSLL